MAEVHAMLMLVLQTEDPVVVLGQLKRSEHWPWAEVC